MKKIRLVPAGKEIEIEDNQTVLSALESAGYALSNNCRAGACGECKTKICGQKKIWRSCKGLILITHKLEGMQSDAYL